MAPRKSAKAAAPAKGKAKTKTSTAKSSTSSAKSAVQKGKATSTRSSTRKATSTAANPPKATSAKSTAATKKTKASTAASTPAARKSAAPKSKPKATKATAKKDATATPEPPKKNAPVSKKRAREVDDEDETEEPPMKKRPAAPKRPGASINEAPTEKLKIYVFGEGSSGELGLGHLHESEKKKVIDVKRPRLNPLLLPETVGVVQISVGGMHVVALTHDNKIITWGVNDQGALGRSTKSGEQLKDMDADASDDDDELNSDLNPLESAPHEVDYIDVPEGTRFTKVAAGDSITMALTSTGLVYGCGTFRANDGILGFSKEVLVQETLVPIPRMRNIVDIVCGANHVLALDKKGNVFAFGSGQQNQLGRRIVERTIKNGLTPSEFGLPRGKIESIATGAYHSFAIDKSGEVWSWGANSFGQTGIPEDAGGDRATILKPACVDALKGKKVTELSGGSHHSLAVTANGDVLAWGRCDGGQAGMDLDDIPDDKFYFDDDKEAVDRRLLQVPTVLPEPKQVAKVAASSDHCLAVTSEGKAYSWGFSANYQTGQGSGEDVEVATLIDNTAVRDEKLVWAGAGGQFSMLASVAMEGVEDTNPQQPTEKPVWEAVPTQINGDMETNSATAADKDKDEIAEKSSPEQEIEGGKVNGEKADADDSLETVVHHLTTS